MVTSSCALSLLLSAALITGDVHDDAQALADQKRWSEVADLLAKHHQRE